MTGNVGFNERKADQMWINLATEHQIKSSQLMLSWPLTWPHLDPLIPTEHPDPAGLAVVDQESQQVGDDDCDWDMLMIRRRSAARRSSRPSGDAGGRTCTAPDTMPTQRIQQKLLLKDQVKRMVTVYFIYPVCYRLSTSRLITIRPKKYLWLPVTQPGLSFAAGFKFFWAISKIKQETSCC